MLEHKKIEILSAFESEDDVRRELIIPLFRKMGFKVIDNQGAQEFGNDVILQHKNVLGGDEFTTIVLKKGKINNQAGSPNSMMKIILEQAVEARTTSIDHPEVKKGTFPNSVWIITNEKISNNAKAIFVKQFKEQFKTVANFEYLDRDNLIPLLDEHWPEFYDDRRPFISQYSEILKGELIGVNLAEFGGGEPRDIKSVLIPQMLTEKQDFASGAKYQLEKLPLTPAQFIKKSRKLSFISGEAGSGKSTLLKRLAIEVVETNGLVPLVVSAANLVDKDINIQELCRVAFIGDLTTPFADILNELACEDLMLLVDGLDEIRCEEKRKNVLRKLTEFSDAEGNVAKVIISTRPETNTEIIKLSKAYKTFEVLPVENKQITNFFGKWFGSKNKNKATELFDELSRKSILDKLPKTPLTLTLLAILYETKGDIPTTLTELYRMFSDLLLGKWDQKKGINTLKDAQVRYGLLSHLAWNMHKNGCTEISQARVLELTKDYLALKLGDEETDPQEVVQDIIERSGLLWPCGEVIKFKHLSFQEFFCSQEIYSKNVFRENLSIWVDDQWWMDVLFFSAGSLKNIDDYVDELMNNKPTEIFSSAIAIGGMLQAAYETNVENKVKLIKKTKLMMPEMMEEVAIALKEMVGGSNLIPHFVPCLLIIEMLSNHYSSKFLERPLQKVFGDDDSQDYLARLFIAASLSKSGNLFGLEDINSDPNLKQPEVIMLCDMMLDEYDKKYNGGKLSPVHKSIKSKVKKNAKAIKGAIALKLK